MLNTTIHKLGILIRGGALLSAMTASAAFSLPYAAQAQQSCGAIGGNWCSSNGLCPAGYISLGETFDCHPCCQSGPSCGAIGGDHCTNTGVCPAGTHSIGVTYDCNPCCKTDPPPSNTCDDQGGFCNNTRACPRGTHHVRASDCNTCCVDNAQATPGGDQAATAPNFDELAGAPVSAPQSTPKPE
jgi:hypothetical protein